MRLAIGGALLALVLFAIFRPVPEAKAPANVETDTRIQLEKMGAVRWKRAE